MHLTNFKNIALGLCSIAMVASCSISTTLDTSIQSEVEAAIKLKEESKIPTKVANQDLIKVNDDIWLGNTSLIEYEGEPLPSYLETKDGITLVSNRPISLYEIGDMLNKTTSLGIRYAADLEEEVTISFFGWGSLEERENFQSLIEAFMEENPKIKVSYDATDSGQYMNSLKNKANRLLLLPLSPFGRQSLHAKAMSSPYFVGALDG